MKVLMDARWSPDLKPSDFTEKQAEAFLSLERTASRIGTALQRTFVFAECSGLADSKFVVHDVRILHEESQHGEYVVEVERLQVLLLEGWRTPDRVWTDEETIEEAEGVQ